MDILICGTCGSDKIEIYDNLHSLTQCTVCGRQGIVDEFQGNVYCHVLGAPVPIGKWVRVIRVVDGTAPKTYLGRLGKVVYFNYDCGCGQSYPGDPLIGLRMLVDNTIQEYWKEEIE